MSPREPWRCRRLTDPTLPFLLLAELLLQKSNGCGWEGLGFRMGLGFHEGRSKNQLKHGAWGSEV